MPRFRNLLIRLRGGEPLPEGVIMPLERRERVLTWGRVRGGRIAAATDIGLRVVGPDNDSALHHWHDIVRAAWHEDGVLEVRGVDGSTVAYQMTEPRGVPAAVREYVTATVVVSVREEMEPGVGIRVVARRDLTTGELHWSSVPDAGVDPDEPRVRAHSDELIARVRRRYTEERAGPT